MTLFKFIGKNMMNEVIRNAPEGFYFRIMGSFFIVEKDSWIKINGFDENTFLYSEEKILSEKLEKFGKYSYYLPDQYVIHDHSRTISKFIKIEFNSNLYFFRNYKKINPLTILIMVFALNVYLYLYYPLLFMSRKIFRLN